MCKDCQKCCLCATCVKNKEYAVNIANPCFFADCDICCDYDMRTVFCNHHLTIEELNDRIKERKEA